MPDYAQLAQQFGGSSQKTDYASLAGQFGGEFSGKPDIYQGLTPETVTEIKEKSRIGRGKIFSEQRAKELADFERLRAQRPELAKEIESTGPFETFAIKAGEGLHTVAEGLGLAKPEDPYVQTALSGLNVTQRSAAGAGELAGETAPFLLPGTLATAPARAALRIPAVAGVGAGEGNILARGKGGIGEQILVSTLLGGVIPGAVELGGSFVSRLGDAILRRTGRPASTAVENGQLTPELLSALDESGISLDDFAQEVQRQIAREYPDQVTQSVQQQSRRQTLEQAGLTGEAAPTQAQITRAKDQFTEQELLARKSSAVNRRLEAQNAALQGRFDEAVQATNGTTGHGGATAADAVRQKSLDLDELVSGAYAAAREAAPTARNVSLNTTADALRRISPLNDRSQGTVRALRDHMRQMGVLGDNFRPQGRITVQQAEELRQFSNTLFEGANAQGRQVIRTFKDGLDSDVGRVSPDIFREARQAKQRFEQDLSRQRTDKFDTRTTSLVRDVLDNKIDPGELLNKAVVNRGKYRAEDIRHLRRYLNSGSDEQRLAGQIAWNDLKAETLDWIRNQATKGPAGENEIRAMTATGLESAINRIGREKLSVLFNPQEREMLTIMQRALRLREPPPGTFLGGGPTALAVDTLASKLGIFGGLFESAKDYLSARQLLRIRTLADSVDQRRSRELQRLLPTGTVSAATVAAQEK